MSVQNDLTMGLAAELLQALEKPSPGQEQIARLNSALARIERALARRLTDFTDEVEPDADHHRALLPSPGLERRARGLRDNLADILRTVRTLRAEVAISPPSATDSSAASLNARLRDLVQTLERHEHGEIDLVQAGMTTDIGAGD
jgi:hypothetical protein